MPQSIFAGPQPPPTYSRTKAHLQATASVSPASRHADGIVARPCLRLKNEGESCYGLRDWQGHGDAVQTAQTQRFAFLFGLTLALSGCSDSPTHTAQTTLADEPQSSTQSAGKADIYGEDSRRDIHDSELSDLIRAQTKSVALVLNVSRVLEIDNSMVRHAPITLSEHFESDAGAPLCDDEPFAEQIAAGHCTAFLIAPQYVATAGHCINGHTPCSQMAFAFDFMRDENGREPRQTARRDFYRCDTLVGRRDNPFEEPETIADREYWFDWAVIKLDRLVTDRRPLKLADGHTLSTGDAIYTIGHPSGLPMKIAEGSVKSDDKTRYFNTSLDVYSGNSGSPVFDAATGQVHGIVIRGSGGGGNSFEVTEDGCGRSKQCEDVGPGRCIGNHALRVDPIRIFSEPTLELTARHTVAVGRPEPDFEQSFELTEIEGQLRLATVNVNGFAEQPGDVVVSLRKNELVIPVIENPRTLPYGRWTATTEDVAGVSPNGSWTVHVLNQGDKRVQIEWVQLIWGSRRVVR